MRGELFGGGEILDWRQWTIELVQVSRAVNAPHVSTPSLEGVNSQALLEILEESRFFI